MSTGTLVTLSPGDRVWDYSFQPPTDTQLADAGVKGVSRYLTVVNSKTIGKMLTYDEAHHLADMGIALMVNLESNPDDPTKGAARGRSDALLVESYRHEHGAWGNPLDWPDELPVVCSLDVGITTDQLNGPVTDYWQAFNDNYSGAVGDYHGVPLHRRLASLGLSTLHWTAGGATSWSSPFKVTDSPTDIVQRVSGVGGSNQLLHPVPFWNPNGEPINPQEDDLLPDERQMLIDVRSALLDPQPVKDPYGNQLNMLWATLYSADVACRPQNLIAAITASVIAALPPAATGGAVDLGPLLAAVNGLQGSLTAVAAAVADVKTAVDEIPRGGTWGK